MVVRGETGSRQADGQRRQKLTLQDRQTDREQVRATSLTTFVGRVRELDELRSLFREGKRLVTLVGIGGIGKTRLALELGFGTIDLGWANVYLVELASLSPDQVDSAVLESVRGGSSRSPLEAAVEHLRDANVLLILDCCEHVLDAARHVAEVLLHRCPSVALLATSRSPIEIAGELVWAVPPLSMQTRVDADETTVSDAARLFADRASSVQARFELGEDAARAVETIVRRVDGIPLAIELAAARIRVLSPEEIVDGLGDHLHLLRGGHRSDPRHRTIRGAVRRGSSVLPASGPPGRAELIGRVAECGALRSVLASVRGGFSATLVLRGEAGIGKTALLEFAIDSARDFRTLRVTGIESEMELGFAAVHQLVRPLWPAIENLPEPQRRALASAFGLADGAAPDRFLVGLAILTLLSEAANERPLLCIVDDAQWLDQASAEVLAFVARRLHADRIAFLFAVREPSAYHVDLEGLSSLQVPGLSAVAARQLITGLVTGPLDWGVGGQIAERAAGNPLALVEMTRELTAEQLAGAVLLPDPLPLSTDVQHRYWRRVAALPPDHQEFLLLAAAEPSGDLDLFERAVRHLGLDSDIARLAEISGLVDLADRVTFRHPLIRSAVYTGSSYQARRRVHAAIAAVSDQGQDVDRIAWHLAAAALAPDEEIAVLLERSADRAKSRGGFSASAAFQRRAAELTPDNGRRAERLLAAAEAEFASGRAGKALALLDQASPDLHGARQQAAGLQLRGAIRSALGDGNQASSTLLQAAQALAPLDPQASRDTLVDGMIAAFYSGSRARLEALEVLAVARAVRPAAGSAGSASIADLILDGYTALLTDGFVEAGPILRRVVGALVADDLPDGQGLRWYGYGMWCATELFDFDAWYLMATRWAAICREKGALMTLPLALDYLGTWQVFNGQLSAGEAANAEGRDILSATGNPDRLGSSRAVELLAPMYRGHAREVREAATAMLRDSAERGQGAAFYYSHLVLTVLEISMHNYEIALGHARVILDDNGPYFGAMILPEAVEAAVHSDDRETAELALERLRIRAEISGTEMALGLLARCRALVMRDDDSEAHFMDAIQHFEHCRNSLQLARTHLLFGEWLRRRRRRGEARRHLRTAHESFETIGATKFAERARLELAAAGVQAREQTVRTSDELTERESQIAGLVAAGATNAQVATQLFISSNTVDYHLRHIYRKLGVTTRTKMAAAILDQV